MDLNQTFVRLTYWGYVELQQVFSIQLLLNVSNFVYFCNEISLNMNSMITCHPFCVSDWLMLFSSYIAVMANSGAKIYHILFQDYETLTSLMD